MSPSNAHEAGLALQRLYEKGVIADEWKGVKPLAFGVFANLTYHTVPMVKTLDDLKGLKISVQGRIAGDTLEALGGTPIRCRSTRSTKRSGAAPSRAPRSAGLPPSTSS